MSTLTGISSSASTSYATQLAQTSTFERSLYSLGSALQNGDLTSAGSILSALMQANPQYAAASGGSSSSTSPINQDFQSLTDAIANNQVQTAQSAWTKLKGDLAGAGITNINDGGRLAANLEAETKTSLDQSLLSTLFGATPADSSVATLLGGAAAGTDAVSTLVSNWVTYKVNGASSATASPVTPAAAGTNLDTKA